MDGLSRRGGVWWARLVVPARLRAHAGRREFVQSTGTHDFSVGKLVASALLAGWRRQLFEWERGKLDNQKSLRLVEGSHVLGETAFVTVRDASAAVGLDRITLSSLASSGRLELFCQLGTAARGHVLPRELLEPIEPALGVHGGLVVPNPDQMPEGAREAGFPGQTLRIVDSQDLAGAALADGLDDVEVLLLDAPTPLGWVFAPDVVLRVAVDDLALSTRNVETLRASLVARVPIERIAHARAERNAMVEAQVLREKAAVLAASRPVNAMSGKWANKLFSQAVAGYCSSPDGLPGDLHSEADQRQRRAGMMLFVEFMGDLSLVEIDGDVLRKFRDGPLKTIPGRVNTLPKEIKCATMRETISALKADGRDWPMLGEAMRRERMQWLARLFAWIHSKGYLSIDPAASLRGETGLTKAEQKAVKRGEEDEDEDGRESFSQAQLQLIFGQLHYLTGHGKHVKKPAYWYGFEFWLPLLGLFAGLRIKEASQLHLGDVREVDGVWCLDINERTADKSLKNVQSARIVPLHPELERSGFLGYCDRLRAMGYRRVFPELTWSVCNAKYAKESGRKMSAMLKNLDMPREGTLVYHCLRHNANNAMLRVPVTSIPAADEHLKKYIRHRVLGHEVSKDTNSKHYTNTTAAEMATLIAGVQHDLPVIKEFDSDFALKQSKRSGNPSSRSRLKLRTSWLGNQPRGRDKNGSRTNAALPGCGGGVPGLWREGQGVGPGQWRA